MVGQSIIMSFIIRFIFHIAVRTHSLLRLMILHSLLLAKFTFLKPCAISPFIELYYLHDYDPHKEDEKP